MRKTGPRGEVRNLYWGGETTFGSLHHLYWQGGWFHFHMPVPGNLRHLFGDVIVEEYLGKRFEESAKGRDELLKVWQARFNAALKYSEFHPRWWEVFDDDPEF